jgi:hypothetical protein
MFMNRLHKLLAATITTLTFVGFADCCVADASLNSNRNSAMIIPLGEEVVGLTLEGPLSGKKAYRLDNHINIPNCWKDSVTWTGSALFYALSSASFTKLLTGRGMVRGAACSLPRTQGDRDYFDTYMVKMVNEVTPWRLYETANAPRTIRNVTRTARK